MQNGCKQTSVKAFDQKFTKHNDSLCRNVHLNINHDDRGIEV